jgi:hypothetical protein
MIPGRCRPHDTLFSDAKVMFPSHSKIQLKPSCSGARQPQMSIRNPKRLPWTDRHHQHTPAASEQQPSLREGQVEPKKSCGSR